MDIAQFRGQIAQLTPLNTLSEKNFNVLTESMRLIHLRRGEKLFLEGQEDKSHFYLLHGSISIRSRLGTPTLIKGDDPEAQRPLDHHQPRKHTATAKTDCICLKIDSPSLEMMLSWEQAGNYDIDEIRPDSLVAADDWMGRLLKNAIFQKLPPERIHKMFQRLQPEKYKEGETIITQGEPGDRFFVITKGNAAVLRSTPSMPQGTLVTQLSAGETFGEDALLSGEPRNATIRALTDCHIRHMPKADFEEIIQQPLTETVDFLEAADLVSRNKARWVDVRLPTEYSQNHLDNSINLPLLFLRLKADKLDRNYHYVVCCEDGRKSRAGAYLLNKHGLNARVLEGGLQAVSTH